MKVIEEILKWAEKLPDWQSDALRRIWTQDKLSDQDITDILTLLKAEHGLTEDGQELPPCEKLTKDHIGSGSVHGKNTILKSVYNLKNVNAISSTQRLTFGSSGLTVIYGANASGKSGFSRVLKRACRARGIAEAIHPNIFSETQLSGSAEASFDVYVEGEGDKTVSWQDAGTAPECLANIAVFDSKTARVYVDEANEVSYIPYGLDVFTTLAELCGILKTRLLQDISTIPPDSPVVSELVGEGKIIGKITATSTEEDINKVARFEKKDQERLDELTKIVADYQANDPKKKAEGFRRQKARVDQLRKDLLNIKRALSGKAIKRLQGLWNEAKTATEAAQLASREAFSSEPLDGTGNSVWRAMFDAAKKFSEQYAYPSKSFPVTDDESRCLLCQQILDADAKDRLKRFWDFVQQDTAKTAQIKHKGFQTELDIIKGLNVHPEKRDAQLIEEIQEISEEVAQGIEVCIPSLTLRIKGIEQAAEDGKWDAIPDLLDFPSKGLSYISKRFEALAKKADSMAKPTEQEKAKNEMAQLSARKKVSDNKHVLLAHIEKLKYKSILEKCQNAVNPRNITIKQSQLMEQALTKELESALANEFQRLGVDHIPLRLKKFGSIGSTYHQLKFPRISNESINLSEVLSEGEHCVVAIASFLGELSTSSHNCGIVFDDPVCSLDHHWRNRVAKRLTSEGNGRQVIIFTHDIVFLFALQREAALQQVPLITQTVRRTNEQMGVCDPTLPWLAKNTNDRLGYMKQLQQKMAKVYREGKLELYNTQVPQFYSLLRETWERAIEEVLLNDAVQRFKPSLETQRLKVVEITDEDYTRVDNGMDRCSSLLSGHDQSPATGESVLPPDDLLADVAELENFVKEIRKRYKDVQDGRKKKLVAPSPDKGLS